MIDFDRLDTPCFIEWRILHVFKLVLFRLLVLTVRDSVIPLSAVAYNVNNNVDEVLLAIVCTVKVITVEVLYPRACGGKDMLNRIHKVSILFPYLLLNTGFLCKK